MLYKQQFDLIFVVLTYRNTKDLSEFIKITNVRVKEKFKIVVVNSFYDENSYTELRRIALDNDCDFINVENKGYGYGNNKGIDFAKKNYKFEYLIVSNPDIEILNLSTNNLKGFEDSIIAPTIRTLSGKDQNPYYYSKIEIVEWLNYYSCKKERSIFAYMGIIINKLYREIALFIDRCLKVEKRRIYASHGSFVIFGNFALNKLDPVYDERMFLFSEENHLARLAYKKNIKTYMIPAIRILHKEDGSVGLESEKVSNAGRESFIIYYENRNN
jgi:GT2 family glycosyltransferase